MERQERLEVIQSLVDAGKTDEEILAYLTNDLKVEVTEPTLKKDIREVRAEETPEPEAIALNVGETGTIQGTEDAGEDVQDEDSEDQPEGQFDPLADQTGNGHHLKPLEADIEQEAETIEHKDETIIADMIDRFKSGESEQDERYDDLRHNIGEERANRLIAVAKGRIELEEMQEKAKGAKADRAKFISKLTKNVNPAVEHIKAAIADIQKAKTVKRKEGKSATSLTAVEKVLTRQIKVLERQVND